MIFALLHGYRAVDWPLHRSICQAAYTSAFKIQIVHRSRFMDLHLCLIYGANKCSLVRYRRTYKAYMRAYARAAEIVFVNIYCLRCFRPINFLERIAMMMYGFWDWLSGGKLANLKVGRRG
jgi:hypothetical protein